MISTREFSYIFAKHTDDIPYPGDEYAFQTLERVKQAVVQYENNYKGKEYEIIFSNGKDLSFEIKDFNLAHMLGIHYKNLTETDFLERFYGNSTRFSSYDTLKGISNDSASTLKLLKEYKSNLFNFYRIKIRSEIFLKFSSFNVFNFGGLWFDINTSKGLGYNSYLKSNIFLFIKSYDDKIPLYLMGIGEKEDGVYIETMFPCKESFLKIYFASQEVAYPTNIAINDNQLFQKKLLENSERLNLLLFLREITEKTGSIIKCDEDFINVIHNQLIKR